MKKFTFLSHTYSKHSRTMRENEWLVKNKQIEQKHTSVST